MKNLIKAGIFALASLVLCFAMVGCGNDVPQEGGAESGIFEAEYSELSKVGNGWSGGNCEAGPDIDGEWNASNGYFVTGLYAEGAVLTFRITADKDVDDAKIVLRLSAEDPAGLLNSGEKDPKTFSITSETYQVKVNGEALNYNTITFNKVKAVNKFVDYTISTGVSLKQGENVIELVTNNAKSLGGTTEATAPIVDCLKIVTTAKLSWTPNTGNIGE